MDAKYERLFQRALTDEDFAAALHMADGAPPPRPEAEGDERTLYAGIYFGYLVGKLGAVWVKRFMTTLPFEKGHRVRYVPSHAKGDQLHPDCCDGVVRSIGVGATIFVLYDNLHGRMVSGDEPFTAQGTRAEDLLHLAPEDERPGVEDFDPSSL